MRDAQLAQAQAWLAAGISETPVVLALGVSRPALRRALPDAAAPARRSHAEAMADPEVRARMSAARKRDWADPEVRARLVAGRKRALADPEVRARLAAACKRAWADPEVRARRIAACKRAWADPEVRARLVAGRKHRALPEMTAAQRKLYAKLRRCGIDRAAALAEIFRAPELPAPLAAAA